MRNLVLLGGGYGNMRIIHRLLPNQLPDDVMITLIDRNPYHCLKTEYYALAAGTISDHHIRVSFPDHPKLKIEYGTISSVDLEGKKVLFHDREPVSYDDAVIGLGCEDKYHNVPGAPEHTYSIQTIDQSRSTYQALNNLNAEATVAIVGAGLSGVELASELRESRKDLNIILFDRGELILSSFPKRLSKYVQSWFKSTASRLSTAPILQRWKKASSTIMTTRSKPTPSSGQRGYSRIKSFGISMWKKIRKGASS